MIVQYLVIPKMENKENDKILEAGKSSIFLTMETWTSQSLHNTMECNSELYPKQCLSIKLPFRFLKNTNNSLL